MNQGVELVAVPRAQWGGGTHPAERGGGSVPRGHEPAAPSDAGDGRTDRRGLLKHGAVLAAGAVAGGAGLAVAAAQPAAAANGAPVLLGGSNTATTTTAVSTTSGTGVSGSSSDAHGAGVLGSDASGSTGTGVKGTSQGGTGVTPPPGAVQPCFANSVSGWGIAGQTGGNGSYGVIGNDSSTGGGTGVAGSSMMGVAVRANVSGNAYGYSNGVPSLWATNSGSGSAVGGEIDNASNSAPSISGTTSGTGNRRVRPDQQHVKRARPRCRLPPPAPATP